MTALMLASMAMQPAQAGSNTAQRLAERATQPDVVLVPPVGSPSPKLGSFVILYTPDEGEPVDPARDGTYEVGPSSCSETLKFRQVDATSKREELWMVSTGIGATIGLPQLNIGGSFGTKSLAGIDYALSHKLILDDGLDELEACCLRSPEKCTDRYISEFWYGTGSIHRVQGSEAALKTTLKQLDKLGNVKFGMQKGWSVAEEWDGQYFAYRVQSFQRPECESYMNDLTEVPGKVLFSGVSARKGSEQAAKRDARNDARQQVVRYLGEEFQLEGDEAISRAEAVISGVKDSLTCMDPVTDTPEGPNYLARVRMYVSADHLEGKLSEVDSKTGK